MARKSILVIVLTALMAAFAFLLCYSCGMRGCFPLDQSIVFDGGYRVLSGQIPYKDFFIPFGPVILWMQAFFFRVFGVTYRAYAIHSATLNALASISVFFIVRRVLSGQTLVALLAGLMTGCWFGSPFGTPWMEQTAFFFGLLALVPQVAGLTGVKTTRSRSILLALSGVAAALAFLSKQNVGLMVFPLLVFLPVAYWSKRVVLDGMYVLLGVLITTCLFLAWIKFQSDADAFVLFFWKLPTSIGVSRLWSRGEFFEEAYNPLKAWVCGTGRWDGQRILPPPVRVANVAAFLMACAAAVTGMFRKGGPGKARSLMLGAMILYMLQMHYLFIQSTFNQGTNGIPYTGLILGLAFGFFLQTVLPGRQGPARVARVAAYVALAVVSILCIRDGMKVSWSRTVQDGLGEATYVRMEGVPALKGLRWGNPTIVKRQDDQVDAEHVRELYEYLKQTNVNFFVFPDCTFLYGVTGRPSPQPFVWFHPGLTYPEKYSEALDLRLTEALESHNVRLLVLERSSWINTYGRLKDFPHLKRLMDKYYREIKVIGIFHISEWVEPSVDTEQSAQL
jgi:hypothetical protein